MKNKKKIFTITIILLFGCFLLLKKYSTDGRKKQKAAADGVDNEWFDEE